MNDTSGDSIDATNKYNYNHVEYGLNVIRMVSIACTSNYY